MSAPSAPIVGGWPTCLQTSIQFWWQPPATGTPLEKYTLACSAISYSQDLSGDVTNYTVTGLTAGTEYEFTLTATNATGTGPALAFPKVGTGLVPFGPVQATASTFNASTALVSWTPSTIANQAPLKGYLVTAIPVTAGASTLYKSEYGYRTSTFIKGISTNTTYQFLVYGVAAPGYCIPFAYTSSLGFGTTSAFSPSSLSRMGLWLDATQITGYTNGQGMTSWVDKGPNALSNAGSNSPTYQTNVLNAQPVVRFNGSTQFFNFGNVLNMGTDGISIFAVANYTNPSGTPYIVSKAVYGPGLGRWGLGHPYANSNAMLVTNTSNTMTTYEVTYADSATGARVHSGIWNRSTLSLYSNAALMASVSAVDAGTASNSFSLYVGAYGNTAGTGPQTSGPNLMMNGDIAETLVYNTSLTPFDRQKVEGYLAWKWGMQTQLPTTHPFKLAAPTSASVFSPSSFSSLQLWLDAADTTTLTGATAVSQWADKSGRSNNVSQATVSQQPVRYTTSNGLTGLSFTQATGGTADTGGQWFRGTFGTAITNNTMSIFTVASMNSATQNYGRIVSLSATASNDFIGGAGGANISRNVGTNAIWMQANGVTSDPGGSITLATPFIADSIFDGTTQYAVINGTQLGTRAFTANFNIARSGIGFQAYQGVTTTSDRWDGAINEVVAYNRALSTDDRQTVEGYLAWKWGLQGSLPATHPYKSSNPGA